MSTFATWIANANDNAARDAALAVARRAPDAPNPLVLTGKIGSGKTHLLQAIANELRASVLHLSAAAFVEQLARAIRTDTSNDFHRRLESLDAILLDDVHLFTDRERTFQEIVLTLSECAAAGVQVVVTSDVRLPGLTATQVKIKRPDAAARAKILRITAEQRGLPMSETDARAIARRTHGNVRELHAAVWRLIAERTVTRA
ncbi:MAG TPA: DnaA/Hda family protein [Thermoanaerobaculia bacterium]|nr:DnaA/Hda family protein [Thermoanaerobaculia bacterium]